jgi:hypothetical protein
MSEYAEQWRDYRKRRSLSRFAFFGYVPACLAFGLVHELLFHSDRFLMPFAYCWMAFFVFAQMRVQYFRCPRCGSRFFGSGLINKGLFNNGKAGKCLHCDLPKYAGEETHAL